MRQPRPPRSPWSRIALATAALALSLPAAASAATPFTIAPDGTGQSTVIDAAGTTYVAYIRPASTGAGQSVGYCRIPAGTDGCATSLELPFPGAHASGAQGVGRAAVTLVPHGKIRVWATCFGCANDFTGAPDYTFRWESNSADNTGFHLAARAGKDAGNGDGTAAARNLVGGGQALVAATVGGGVQAREAVGVPPAETYPVSYAAISPLFLNYRPSVVTAPDGRLIYASDDGDRMVSSTYLPPALATVSAINAAVSWSAVAAPTSDDGGTSSISSMSLTSGPSGTYVGYDYFVPLDERLRVRRFDPATLRFGPPVDIQGNDPLDDSVSASVINQDAGGRLHAVWESLHADGDRLRYARTDAAGNGASVLGTLAQGERFIDPQLAAGPGNEGVVVWHGNSETALRAVRLEPTADPLPGGGGDGGGGDTGGNPGGGGIGTPGTKVSPPLLPKAPTKSTKVSVPGGTLSFTTPKACVPRGGKFSARMAFAAKRKQKAAHRTGNVVIKVLRADFYLGKKRVKRDTKAPFVQRITVSAKSKRGSTIKLRAVAKLKVKKTSRPRTKTIRATLKVCR